VDEVEERGEHQAANVTAGKKSSGEEMSGKGEYNACGTIIEERER
tara:strand:+ start:121 stop:255 length:135 start_codon:yes stop_codon:yes gene_type:complete